MVSNGAVVRATGTIDANGVDLTASRIDGFTPATTAARSTPDQGHHQPWCRAHRSKVAEMVAMTSSRPARCQKSVRSLTMMFIP